MNWNNLTDLSQLDTIDAESKKQKVLIFKHSTRCSISDTALNRFERKWTDGDENLIKPYYLDLLAHRDISDAIAGHYRIRHESPQALLIVNETCVFSQSHMGIDLKELLDVSV